MKNTLIKSKFHNSKHVNNSEAVTAVKVVIWSCPTEV